MFYEFNKANYSVGYFYLQNARVPSGQQGWATLSLCVDSAGDGLQGFKVEVQEP